MSIQGTCAFLRFVLHSACAYTPDELRSFHNVGLSNIVRETINGVAPVEEGYIPTWLEG